MILTDIHTHINDGCACTTSSASNNNSATAVTSYATAGIHPWHIASNWEEQLKQIASLAKEGTIVAIGECGIDRIKSPATIALQREILAAQTLIAEQNDMPLILHCVKAQDDIIALHREIKPAQAWIVHGFRGKPQQAEQLTKEGLYLSFGELFNPESVAVTPADKLFVESDTSSKDIENIYRAIAAARGITVEELAATTLENARRCGFPFNL